MKTIIIILLLGMTLGVNAQFTDFSEPESVPTTQELIASLTAGQRVAIIDCFATGKSPIWLSKNYGVPRAVYVYFDAFLTQINFRADAIMTDNPSYDQTQLTTAVYNEFSSDFTSGQINAVINRKVLWSNGVGDADWTYYSSQFD